MTRLTAAATIIALAAMPAMARAVPFTEITIGDRDGFGFTSITGLHAASGLTADTDGNNRLGPGEFLPDLNGNGRVGTAGQDNFDNRSSAEKLSTAVGGSGFTDNGSRGAKWTDIALSMSVTSALDFPDGDPAKPNEPRFVFDFFVTDADIQSGTPLVLALVFADRDVGSGRARITTTDGTTFGVALRPQPDGADGLIQALTVPLGFGDVFTAAPGGFAGRLGIDVLLPGEPYTAFDFAAIGAAAAASTPEPSALVLLGVGLLLLAVLLRRRHRRRRPRPRPARARPDS